MDLPPPLARTVLSLHYESDNNRWQEVPDWVRFYIALGQFITPQHPADRRSVLGLSVPTRGLIAPLIATGCVINTLNAALRATRRQYFHELCRLKEGTGVMVLRRNEHGRPRQFQGVVVGTECMLVTMPGGSRQEVEMLRIQISRGSMNNNNAGSRTFLIDENRCDMLRILDADESVSAGDLPAVPKGRAVTPVSDFVRIAFETESHYVARSQVSCLIVGNLNQLRRETQGVPFAVRSGPETYHSGNLGQLLRVRKFTTVLRRYYADALSTESRRPPQSVQNKPPAVVIFDGGKASLEWRDHFPASNQIVILDQTERVFASAAESLNERYERRADDEDPPSELPPPPSGVEATFFQESVG